MIFVAGVHAMRMDSSGSDCGSNDKRGLFLAGPIGQNWTLEAGKQADISVLMWKDYREIPYYFGVNKCWIPF